MTTNQTLNVQYLLDTEDGSPFAFFPEIEAGSGMLTVYAHMGQHSGASPEYIEECETASAAEYSDLHREVSRIYETGDDAVSLSILNESGFHFSMGAALSLTEDCINSTWARPFSADMESDPCMMEDIRDCGAQGDASAAVTYVRDHYGITASPEDAQDYLRGFGAWDDDELADHDANIDRLIWLAGSDLREHGEFYMGC